VLINVEDKNGNVEYVFESVQQHIHFVMAGDWLLINGAIVVVTVW
jgi:hypothetical protein